MLCVFVCVWKVRDVLAEVHDVTIEVFVEIGGGHLGTVAGLARRKKDQREESATL